MTPCCVHAAVLQVPSCHVIGHQDWVKQHAINLARQFQSPIVIMHPRGHVIPRLTGHHLAVLKAYLAAFLPQGGSSSSGSSTAAGGALGASQQPPLSRL